MSHIGIDECKVVYIECLLKYFDKHSKGKKTRRKSIKTLVDLTKIYGRAMYIHKQQFIRAAGDAYGIVRWMEAGVVEKQNSNQAFRIRDEFYETLIGMI